jgi:quinol monooxygenase YgiN
VPIDRRDFVFSSAIAVAAGLCTPAIAQDDGMYGLIGRMMAKPGQRDALLALLLDGTTDMPGCLSYVIALDTTDADALWITEVWDGEASHAASLQLPKVQAAIGRARPLIAGFRERFVTTPVGGQGLPGR